MAFGDIDPASFQAADPFRKAFEFGIQMPGQIAQMQTAPQMAKQALLQAIANTQKTQAQVPLLQQQAQADAIKNSLPFGGAYQTGIAGQLNALQATAQQFGENSPQYQALLNELNLSQQAQREKIAYQQGLVQTMPQRALSSFGKTVSEQQKLAAGQNLTNQPAAGVNTAPINSLSQMYQGQAPEPQPNVQPNVSAPQPNAQSAQQPMQQPTQQPGTENAPQPNASITPENQEALNKYFLRISKESTDPAIRLKALYATNMEKTMGLINRDDLTRYAGIVGHAEILGQELLSQIGKESPEYDDYLKSQRNAIVLAHQLRQFYGDSIQPSMLAKLEDMASPATWKNNPKQAGMLYDSLVQLANNEMQTFRDALQGPQVYSGKGTAAPSSEVAPAPNDEKQLAFDRRQTGQSESDTRNLFNIPKPITIPTFTTKQEYQSWLRGLSPSQKQQVLGKMRNQ